LQPCINVKHPEEVGVGVNVGVDVGVNVPD